MIYCPNCGAQNEQTSAVCSSCGSPLAEDSYTAAPQPAAQPQPAPQPTYYQPPQQPYQPPVNVINVQQGRIPPEYQPLSAWAYFGYTLLFAIPIVGFILLIVFSFSSGNINRRNYARSYFCWLLILAIVIGIVAIIAAVTGANLFNWFSSLYYR